MSTRAAVALLITALILGGRACQAQALDTLAARVGGRRIHMVAAGGGSPTIVLEAGCGSTSRTWRALQQDLAASHRVVAYDRAGLGASEASPRPLTSRVFAEELREALRSAGLSPPFLLIGHSAGGLHARVFASMYPQEVVGLVLVDPTPDGFEERARREMPSVFAHFDSLERADAVGASAGERREDAGWAESLNEARRSDGGYSGPVILLSASRPELFGLGPIWTDQHRRWAAAEPTREYVLFPEAGHNLHQERREAVLAAVRRVLTAP
ncbi:MAG: alpha/beta hydrolase [Gemmatimonadaceae bacterium]|nr:alpha/beta hydrolase [Gemmatimonadaceae bacterium]